MKKLVVSLIALFLISSIFAVLQASEDDFIYPEEGTIINGEDISKLPKEELQYIPENWRKGEYEEIHPVEETEEKADKEEIQPRARMMLLYPNVNSEIDRRDLKASPIDYLYNNDFFKFNYRNGFGAVEGVVAHETANDNSTIFSEISFMSRNHNNAFVHAFVDHNRVIEIHPLELGAWGAGRHANKRFVHVELVRVKNYDDFVKSINNYANYIAEILYNYDLGVNNAEKDGNGTLWSHFAVSNHLGATTHTDPHGYFDRYGYKWNDFVSLVQKKYKAINGNSRNTSKLGHIRSENVDIYKRLGVNTTKIKARETYTNRVYYIKKQTRKNGKLYYLLSQNPSSSNGIVGWVAANDVSINTHKGVDKKTKPFYISGEGEAFTKAWGGSHDKVYNLKNYENQKFNVHLTERVGSNTWYRGDLNGKTVWVHSSHVNDKPYVSSNTSRLGHIRSSNVRIYSYIGDHTNSFKAGTEYTDAVYYVKEQATYKNELYYLISKQPSSNKGVVGWVKAKDLSSHRHAGVDKEEKILYIKGTGKGYEKAWGGSKDLVYKSMERYKDQVFSINLTEKVGSNTWYRGTLDGTTTWLHSSYLKQLPTEATSMLGHIRSSNVDIYPYLGDETKAFKASDQYTHAVYYIKRQTNYRGDKYYLISKRPSATKGVVGWVKARDLSTHNHVGMDKQNKTFYIKGTGKGYSKAWGGSKDLVADMSDYKDQPFIVNLTEKVGNNTWYRGTLDGKTIWLHSNYVKELTAKATSKLGHIRHSNVKIYPTVGLEHNTFKASTKYTDAVYYIKSKMTYKDQKYYLISKKPSSTKGVVGWVRATDLSTHTHVGVSKQNEDLIIKGTGKGYSKAWGGSKDQVYAEMSKYQDQPFTANLTEKVGNNIWYRGILDGKTTWLHESYLTKE